jgi:cytochrome c553
MTFSRLCFVVAAGAASNLIPMLMHVAVAADLEAAKKQAQVCAGCHGEAGISQQPEIPSLAGQTDAYVQWQLVYFRSGSRKNEVMAALTAEIKNEDIRVLGAYYAALPPAKPGAGPQADPALTQQGANIAKQNRCANCHGDDYAGRQAAPRLTGQREDYLLKSLRDFKSGARTGGGMAAMPEAVFPLSDDDLKALAHFLASVS